MDELNYPAHLKQKVGTLLILDFVEEQRVLEFSKTLRHSALESRKENPADHIHAYLSISLPYFNQLAKKSWNILFTPSK